LNRLQTKQQETSLMAECNELEFELPGFSGRKIEGNFEGGNVSSDGGLVLLRQVDRWIGLTKTLAQRLPDGRDPDKIEHSLESMLRPARSASLPAMVAGPAGRLSVIYPMILNFRSGVPTNQMSTPLTFLEAPPLPS
jgi:hypothetical protein